MLVLASPATVVELAEHVGPMSRRDWRIAREMFDTGAALAFRQGETILAFGGFYPLDGEGDAAEAWFWALPAARRAILPLAVALRLTCRAAPYRSIVTVCRSEAGKRLARFAGFRPAVETELGEAWIHGADFQSLRRRQSGPHQAGAGQPAPLPGAAGAAAG